MAILRRQRETGCRRKSRSTDVDQAELDALRDRFYVEGELSDRDWDRLAELERRESWDYWSDGAADVGLPVTRARYPRLSVITPWVPPIGSTWGVLH